MSTWRFGVLTAVVSAMAFGLAAAASSGALDLGRIATLLPSPSGHGGCIIKGNVSIGSGERIYHVPGQENYLATRISPEYGERWFCSEAEALAAGWRRAGM